MNGILINMKKVVFGFAVCFFALFFNGCCKNEIVYRMKEVTFFQNGESVTVSADDLKNKMPENYEPNGGLYDNYFFTLCFDGNDEGKAIFVFSELGNAFKNTIADSFTVEEKSGGRIILTFTNGQTLSGEKQHNKLVLSSGDVSYVFEKK